MNFRARTIWRLSRKLGVTPETNFACRPFQRQFVWEEGDTKELVDSIISGYPRCDSFDSAKLSFPKSTDCVNSQAHECMAQADATPETNWRRASPRGLFDSRRILLMHESSALVQIESNRPDTKF